MDCMLSRVSWRVGYAAPGRPRSKWMLFPNATLSHGVNIPAWRGSDPVGRNAPSLFLKSSCQMCESQGLCCCGADLGVHQLWKSGRPVHQEAQESCEASFLWSLTSFQESRVSSAIAPFQRLEGRAVAAGRIQWQFKQCYLRGRNKIKFLQIELDNPPSDCTFGCDIDCVRSPWVPH